MESLYSIHSLRMTSVYPQLPLMNYLMHMAGRYDKIHHQTIETLHFVTLFMEVLIYI